MPVAVQTIVVRGASRARVTGLIRSLPGILSGKSSYQAAEARTVLVRAGLTVQAFLYAAFMQKAQGMSDASGLRWPKLSPYTIRKKERTAPANARRILREFDILSKSLKPATRPAAARASVPAVPQQIFRLGRGSVTLGTTRPHAGRNHRGGPGLPQRRLWPKVEQWPSVWWNRLLIETRQSIINMLKSILRGTP